MLDTLIEGGRLAGGGGSAAAAGAVPLGRHIAGRPASPALSEIMSVFLRKHRLVG